MKTPICDFVRDYRQGDWVRFHMPGHKGKPFLGMEAMDLTEIAGADELYHPEGIIAESEGNASALFGSRSTCYGTEGSSQCIRAMLYLAAMRTGEKPLILAARNVHKAFVYGAALMDLEVRWLYPKETDSLCRCSISPGQLEKALQDAPRPVSGVYVTSPDYLGGMEDVKALAEVCHRWGTILMVDNAHGAFLHFLDTPMHPLDLGADLCCDSAHKTLPVLTGGAYLHVGRNCPEVGDPKRAMEIFGSTSPSYLILQSLDLANRYLLEDFPGDLRKTCNQVAIIREKLRENGWYSENADPMRITLNARESGWNGTELANRLRSFRIECEYADPEYVVLMAAPRNPAGDFARLAEALGENTRKCLPAPQLPRVRPRQGVSIRTALLSAHGTVPLREADGRICGAPTVSCPPAIPVAVSGERIDKDCIAVMEHYGIQTVEVLKL